MREAKCKISAYLTEEERRQFEHQVLARGVTESAYIREMLGFDLRRRGAPKGPRQKKAAQPQAVKPRAARKKRSRQPSAAESRASWLPFPD
jgi:hypothetical protein